MKCGPGCEPLSVDLEPPDLEPADLEPADLEPADLEPLSVTLHSM